MSIWSLITCSPLSSPFWIISLYKPAENSTFPVLHVVHMIPFGLQKSINCIQHLLKDPCSVLILFPFSLSSNSLPALLGMSLRASYKYGAKYTHMDWCSLNLFLVDFSHMDPLLWKEIPWSHRADWFGFTKRGLQCVWVSVLQLYTLSETAKWKCLALLCITIAMSDAAWGCMGKQFCDFGSCWFLIKASWKVLWECELNTRDATLPLPWFFHLFLCSKATWERFIKVLYYIMGWVVLLRHALFRIIFNVGFVFICKLQSAGRKLKS